MLWFVIATPLFEKQLSHLSGSIFHYKFVLSFKLLFLFRNLLVNQGKIH